jgi:hypothetical protein
MLSPKQAERMTKKERRVLCRAVRAIVGHLKTRLFTFQMLPPYAPTSTRRERGGVIIYEWEAWLGVTVTVLRVTPTLLGRHYYLTRRAGRGHLISQRPFSFEAVGATLFDAFSRLGDAYKQVEPVLRSFSYVTDPRGAERFEAERRRLEAEGRLLAGSATIKVDFP